MSAIRKSDIRKQTHLNTAKWYLHYLKEGFQPTQDKPKISYHKRGIPLRKPKPNPTGIRGEGKNTETHRELCLRNRRKPKKNSKTFSKTLKGDISLTIEISRKKKLNS